MARFSDQEFTVGLIQMSCAMDPNENLEKIKWKIREAAAKGADSHLPPGVVPLAVLLSR